MMDLGVLGIEPSSLEVLSIDKQETSLGQRLAVRREHGLNQKYLRFHLENIYVREHEGNEIRLSSANREI